MGKFLTTSAITQQVSQKGMYKLLANELYKDDDGTIYLAWKNFQTDNFTWICSNEWDTRCSHIHDVGCKYHQVVIVKLTEEQLRRCRYLVIKNNEVICQDLPAQFLEVKKISKLFINNLFYRMLKAADCPKTPKHIQLAYRTGVALNVGWLWSGKIKIDLNRLYDEDWNKLQKDPKSKKKKGKDK